MPGDERAPVVADEVKAPSPEHVGDADHVLVETSDVVVLDAQWPSTRRVAALVRRDDPITGRGDGREHVPPLVCGLRESVEAEHEVAVGRAGDQGVELERPDADADLLHPRSSSRVRCAPIEQRPASIGRRLLRHPGRRVPSHRTTTGRSSAHELSEGTTDMSAEISLAGWDIVRAESAEWTPWGASDKARAKVLGSADGYMVVLVEAQPGYAGEAHKHAYAEFNYVVDGTLRNQGQEMSAGDGYAAAAGSTHTDFSTDTGATYIVIFKL